MRLPEDELWENFKKSLKPCLWSGGWTLEEVRDAFRTGFLLGSLRNEANQKIAGSQRQSGCG